MKIKKIKCKDNKKQSENYRNINRTVTHVFYHGKVFGGEVSLSSQCYLRTRPDYQHPFWMEIETDEKDE